MGTATFRPGALLVILLTLLAVSYSVSAAAGGSGGGRGTEPPVARIVAPANNSTYTAGEQVYFDGSGSFDPDGKLANYSWDLGDGMTSNEKSGYHSYKVEGEYRMVLTVIDDDGMSGTASVLVRIEPRTALSVSIDVHVEGTLTFGGPFVTEAGKELPFVAYVDGTRGILTYSWDFGDGTGSTDPAPSHTYSRAGNYTVTVRVSDGTLEGNAVFIIEVVPGKAPPVSAEGYPDMAIPLIVGAILIIGFAAFFGGTELGLLVLSPIFIFLYSKIRSDQILDNYTRGQVHGYILANPGEHYNSIKKALSLNNGTLAYHLKRLETENIIKSAMDGFYRRYYPAGMKVPEPDGEALTEVQKIVLGKISETPGISQSDIASLMGLSRSTVNYHIERLLARGLIRRERSGMKNRCFISEEAPAAKKEGLENT